jgi:hypothetical protein
VRESTPEVASAPEPVSSWPFRIAPGSASRVAALGSVLSTVTVRGAEVKVLPAWSVVVTRRS